MLTVKSASTSEYAKVGIILVSSSGGIETEIEAIANKAGLKYKQTERKRGYVKDGFFSRIGIDVVYHPGNEARLNISNVKTARKFFDSAEVDYHYQNKDYKQTVDEMLSAQLTSQ